MISQLISYDPYLQVMNPGTSYVSGYNSGMNVGQVRYNTSTQSLEAYDGNSWIVISNNNNNVASIKLSDRAREILDYAEKQMMQEQKFDRLSKVNPTIADALSSYREAAEKLQVVISLCEE